MDMFAHQLVVHTLCRLPTMHQSACVSVLWYFWVVSFSHFFFFSHRSHSFDPMQWFAWSMYTHKRHQYSQSVSHLRMKASSSIFFSFSITTFALFNDENETKKKEERNNDSALTRVLAHSSSLLLLLLLLLLVLWMNESNTSNRSNAKSLLTLLSSSFSSAFKKNKKKTTKISSFFLLESLRYFIFAITK